MAKAKNKNQTIVFEQLGNDGKPNGHTQKFTTKVAERLLRMKDSKWRLVEQEKPKAAKVVKQPISDEKAKNLMYRIDKMPKQTSQLIEWIGRQNDTDLLEMAREHTQSNVAKDAMRDRIKELTNTKK